MSSVEFEAWAATELELVPEGAGIIETSGDYAMTREQARLCGLRGRH